MHLNGLARQLSGSIKCSKAGYGLPWEFDQPVIISGVNQCEFAAGKRNSPDSGWIFFPVFVGTSTRRTEDTARAKIGAGLFEKNYLPPAGQIVLLHTDLRRPVRAHHPDRKKTVVATDMIQQYKS